MKNVLCIKINTWKYVICPTAFADDDDSLNPFQEIQPPSVGPPEWVLELPEELDQAIAQRNFEDAVSLIDSGREFFDSAPKTAAYNEMRWVTDGEGMGGEERGGEESRVEDWLCVCERKREKLGLWS